MSSDINWAAHYGPWTFVVAVVGYLFCAAGFLMLFSTSPVFGVGLIVFGGVLVFSAEMRKTERRSEVYFAGVSASLRHIDERLKGR
jgi:hypothetical protein